MPINKPVKPARGNVTRIELPDQTIITVPPVTIEQVRRCLGLDPDEGHKESMLEYVERLATQFQILVGKDFAHLTGVLTLDAVQQIMSVLFAAGCGIDAEEYARFQIVERQVAHRRTTVETLQDIDAATVALAAELRLRPSDVAEMPLADCAAIRAEIAKLTNADARFQAKLHDKELQ